MDVCVVSPSSLFFVKKGKETAKLGCVFQGFNPLSNIFLLGIPGKWQNNRSAWR